MLILFLPREVSESGEQQSDGNGSYDTVDGDKVRMFLVTTITFYLCTCLSVCTLLSRMVWHRQTLKNQSKSSFAGIRSVTFSRSAFMDSCKFYSIVSFLEEFQGMKSN